MYTGMFDLYTIEFSFWLCIWEVQFPRFKSFVSRMLNVCLFSAASGGESEPTDHGIFLLRAMVKMEFPKEKIVEHLKQMTSNG